MSKQETNGSPAFKRTTSAAGWPVTNADSDGRMCFLALGTWLSDGCLSSLVWPA